MAKSTSNSDKRIFGTKSIKKIYTLSILSFVIKKKKKPFDITLFYGRQLYNLEFVCYFSNQPCECCIVFHHCKWGKSPRCLKCFWCSKLPKGIFLLIIFIIIWNNGYSLAGTGTISLIASSWECCHQCINSVFIWSIDVARLSSKITKSSTVISSSSQSWVRRLLISSSITLSLVMLLTNPCLNPHFWKQLINVSVDTSLRATCNQWTVFATLTSCIISEAFLPFSVRETTYFSSLFMYLHLNTLIIPASSGSNQEVATKKAAVGRCLEFLPRLHLLDFLARIFFSKDLKTKPSSSMF